MKKHMGISFCIWVACLGFLVSGCGKTTETDAAQKAKNYVYTFTSWNDKVSDREISEVYYGGESIFLTSYRYEQVSITETTMDESSMDGTSTDAFSNAATDDNTGTDAMEFETTDNDTDAMEFETTDNDTDTMEFETTDNDTEIMEDEAGDDDMESVEGGMDGDIYYDEEYFYDEEKYDEEYREDAYFQVIRLDMNADPLSEYEIKMGQNEGIYNFCVDENANSYLILCGYGQDTSNPEWIKDLYSLVSYTDQGQERFRLQLGTDTEEEDYYYVNQFACVNGKVYLFSSKGLEVYDTDGNFIKLIQSQVLDNGTMFLLRDGSIAFLIYGNNGRYLRTLDLETEEFSESVTFPFNAYGYSFYAGKDSDFLLTNNVGIYTYDIGDEGMDKMTDFVDSDILCNDLNFLTQTGEGQFFGTFYDTDTWQVQFGVLDKVAPELVKDKKVLTLACYWLDDDIRRRVVDYNKNSTEYRIRVEDYYQYNTDDDYTVGMTKMNTDIASGNAPDILILSADMPIDSYISKGLLADMLPLLENDPELNVEDYSSHIMDLYSQDGKWYQMVPSYYLYTLFGKASEVGEEPGWTLDELKALWEKKGKDVEVFNEMTQQGLLNYCMLFASGEFVDWEKGECNFDSAEFIELLEFIAEFPEEINYDNIDYDEEYWLEQETMFRTGKALLQSYALSGFDDFKYCEQGSFGEKITAIGFPVQEGVGSVIMANMDYAISAKSSYQQEAWNFLRYYLTPEYQDTIEYGWPILNSSMEKKVEKAKEIMYYTDEEGNQVEYNETYYIGGMEVEMLPLTQEDCDRVLGFIESADHAYSYNDTILSIVTEEAAPFFEGKKTAKEVTDIIQSRVGIYVNENK